MTLRARYRRSPEGCSSPAWRCPMDVMCRPGCRRPPANPGGTVGRTRRGPARGSSRAGQTRPCCVPAASTPQTAAGLACRAPEAPPASDPTPPDAVPRSHPTVPPTAPVLRPSKPPPRLVPAPSPAPLRAPASPALLAALASAAATTWIPTLGRGIPRPSRVTTCLRRSLSMNPFGLRLRYVSDQAAFGHGRAALGPGGLSRARTDGITPVGCASGPRVS